LSHYDPLIWQNGRRREETKGRYDNYKEMVEAMDTRVGRIAAVLQQLGLQRQTLVLFVGDNGTPKQSILRAEGKRMVRVPVVSTVAGRAIPGGKGNLTDDGTHVPLIASWAT
jgi:arylsulfatase A